MPASTNWSLAVFSCNCNQFMLFGLYAVQDCASSSCTPCQLKISGMKFPSKSQQILRVDGDSKHSRSSVEEHGQVRQNDVCNEKEPEH